MDLRGQLAFLLSSDSGCKDRHSGQKRASLNHGSLVGKLKGPNKWHGSENTMKSITSIAPGSVRPYRSVKDSARGWTLHESGVRHQTTKYPN